MDPHEVIRSIYYVIAILGVLVGGFMGLIWRHVRLAERVTAVEHNTKTHTETLGRCPLHQETSGRLSERMSAIEERLKGLTDRVERDLRSLSDKVDDQGRVLSQQAVNVASLAGRLEGAATKLLEAVQGKGMR